MRMRSASRNSSEWLIHSYDKTRAQQSLQNNLGPGKYEISIKKQDFNVKHQSNQQGIFEKYFQQHIGKNSMPNYVGIKTTPQPLDNPGPGYYNPENQNFIPSQNKKVKKARYSSIQKNQSNENLSVSRSWRYLDSNSSMLIQENKTKSPKKFYRINLGQIKGGGMPSIPYEAREQFNPSSLGPGKYDIKYDYTERGVRAPSIGSSHASPQKLPTAIDLKEKRHIGHSMSRAQLEVKYGLLSEQNYKKIERESPSKPKMGSHIFSSKVDRLPSIDRHYPGPGEYDVKLSSSLKPLINPIHPSRN